MTGRGMLEYDCFEGLGEGAVVCQLVQRPRTVLVHPQRHPQTAVAVTRYRDGSVTRWRSREGPALIG